MKFTIDGVKVEVNLVGGLNAYLDEYGNVQVEFDDETLNKLNAVDQIRSNAKLMKKALEDASTRFEYEVEQAGKIIEELGV